MKRNLSIVLRVLGWIGLGIGACFLALAVWDFGESVHAVPMHIIFGLPALVFGLIGGACLAIGTALATPDAK